MYTICEESTPSPLRQSRLSNRTVSLPPRSKSGRLIVLTGIQVSPCFNGRTGVKEQVHRH
ncbi:hypothetical protein [Veiled chameleon serpentovirus A]|uniref:Uncharacterized protein n=1 Tax=Veiled chameleon serpentovirus A TaxID=2806429 RepID=A0AAE7P8B6_9NIDO|nr:hypothetical protein QKS92_gp10 [Veiled chameleon serpentovirus A]QRC47056.1 hypothetical protein [Veiled chameleon serpentovirus A]